VKISTIHAGFFKLDGGAMFGVVPKKLWDKLNPADANNMCTWAMRCLLIETGDRKILVDTGMGNKQSDRFRSHFEPHGPYDLMKSLNEKGIQDEDITDVFLTHLHFDHAGGAMKLEDGKIIPSFPNAVYWTNKRHFNWAKDPNPREKASFPKENFIGLEEANVLKYINVGNREEWLPGIKIHYFHGHTEAMMAPEITLENGKSYVFCADLMPSSYHIRMPYVMSYDIRPLITLKEKKEFLEYAINKELYLIFEHDPKFECGQVRKDNKERYEFGELKPVDKTLQ
jgi:glyoxylase-like metal-dependent hydrolase (beta-lactamase superfamily II)